MNQYLLPLFLAGTTACAADFMTVTLKEAKEDYPGYMENLFIESQFNHAYTLVQTLGLGKNNQFNFCRVYLQPTEGKANGRISLTHNLDDTSPWQINNVLIGANHGEQGNRLLTFSKPHGLTEANLGEEFSDEKGTKFYLMKVLDPLRLWVLSEDKGSNGIWVFDRYPKGLLKQGEKVLPSFQNSLAQMYPAIRIAKQNYLTDGKVPLPKGVPVKCNSLVVEEEYDIISPSAVLEYVRKNRGKKVAFNAPNLASVISNKLSYTFRPDGSCIISHRAKINRRVKLDSMGFLQAQVMDKGKYEKYEYYVPKTVPFQVSGRTYSFADLVDFSKPLPSSVYLKKNSYADPNNPPERFVQYLHGGKQPPVGFAAGYSLLEGVSVPSMRAKSCDFALYIYTNRKSYPRVMDNTRMPFLEKGLEFYCLAFRQYFDATNSYYYHQQGDSFLFYADFHKPVEKEMITLPEKLRGKKMSVVEQSQSLKMQREKDTLLFRSPGKNGYAVLRFQ